MAIGVGVYTSLCASAALADPVLDHVSQRHPTADWCVKLQAFPNASLRISQLYQVEIAKSDDLRSTRLVTQLLAAMKCVGGKEQTLRNVAKGTDPKLAKTRKFADRLLKDEPVTRDRQLKIRVKRKY